MDRNKKIIQTSIISIITNILLASFKAFVGLVSHSIAIVLDAVNNLSDALSSLITIIGAKLAAKPADRKHPFGYGRVEYMTSLIVGALIVYAGVTSLIESVREIMNPETPSYSTVSLIIVAVGVVVKLLLGRYVKSVGEKVNSGALVGSANEALLDAFVSFSTLVAAILFVLTKLSIEAYLALVISILIIKSGIELLVETINRLLGERADSDLSKLIKATACSVPNVVGAFDLVLHDYGPDRTVGSIHLEIDGKMKADEIDKLIREVSNKVMKEHDVMLESISIYARNSEDTTVNKVRDDITSIALSHKHVIEVHGFYLDEVNKTLQFDLVVDFDCDNPKEIFETAVKDIQDKYPDYQLITTLDRDMSD